MKRFTSKKGKTTQKNMKSNPYNLRNTPEREARNQEQTEMTNDNKRSKLDDDMEIEETASSSSSNLPPSETSTAILLAEIDFTN